MANKKEKKFLIDNPSLMSEWHWEKNNELEFNPNTLTCGSHKKVWWICNKSHEWQAIISNRNKGKGCPFCSRRYATIGNNDLATLNPELIKEWDIEKNGDLSPQNFTANSEKKVWWKCAKGHEWQAIIANRSKGSGCPYCSGRCVIKGINDLQTINPTLSINLTDIDAAPILIFTASFGTN